MSGWRQKSLAHSSLVKLARRIRLVLWELEGVSEYKGVRASGRTWEDVAVSQAAVAGIRASITVALAFLVDMQIDPEPSAREDET